MPCTCSIITVVQSSNRPKGHSPSSHNFEPTAHYLLVVGHLVCQVGSNPPELCRSRSDFGRRSSPGFGRDQLEFARTHADANLVEFGHKVRPNISRRFRPNPPPDFRLHPCAPPSPVQPGRFSLNCCTPGPERGQTVPQEKTGLLTLGLVLTEEPEIHASVQHRQ